MRTAYHRRVRSLRRLWPLIPLVLVAFLATPAFAQLDRGQIAGFVKDQSGGVIPGATVTATSAQTGRARTAVTDANGYYVFPAVTPGVYDLSVELEGFKKWIQVGVTLDAASSITIDPTLETGTITEGRLRLAAVFPLNGAT